MNREEIRKILALYRPSGEDAADPLIAKATESAQQDPELAQWFAEEQHFDRKFAEALADTPLPFGLKTRILARTKPSAHRYRSWSGRIGWAIAAIAVLLVLFSSWRGPFQPAVSQAEFPNEMVSFIRLAPPLDLESSHLTQIQSWLGKTGAPAQIDVPDGLAALEPLGCRVLSFRGKKVTLICFRRGGARLTHLFVVDRDALPRLRSNAAPIFAQEGDWLTSLWREGDRVYLLAAQGDRTLLNHYLAARKSPAPSS